MSLARWDGIRIVTLADCCGGRNIIAIKCRVGALSVITCSSCKAVWNATAEEAHARRAA